MEDPVYLYFLVRTDLGSMNRGRVAAQVSHATSDFHLNVSTESRLYREWASAGAGGIGVVCVLDALDLRGIENVIEEARTKYPCGIYKDPDYAVRDGSVVFGVPVATVGWVLCPKGAIGADLRPIAPDDPDDRVVLKRVVEFFTKRL